MSQNISYLLTLHFSLCHKIGIFGDIMELMSTKFCAISSHNFIEFERSKRWKDPVKGDQAFWDESEWTGIIACPFSSTTDVASPVEGIYFTGGSSGRISIYWIYALILSW